MDLLDSLDILLKRWWLTLPLFLLTLIGVTSAAVVLPWSYEAKADMVFLASTFQAKQAGGNPWLVFDGSLTVTAEVVGREMMDDRTVAEIRAKGLTSTYLIGVAPNSAGPVLVVDVKGKDSADTAATLNAVMKMIPQKLDRIQADHGVAAASRIRLSVISVSPLPDLKSTSKIRTLAVLAFGGLVSTVAVPLLAESMSFRRKGAEKTEQADRRPRPAGDPGRNKTPPQGPRRATPHPRKPSPRPNERPERRETPDTGHVPWAQQGHASGAEWPVSTNGSAAEPTIEPETKIAPAQPDHDFWPFHPGSRDTRASRAAETDV